jgi:hypothetical protein
VAPTTGRQPSMQICQNTCHSPETETPSAVLAKGYVISITGRRSIVFKARIMSI